MSALRHHAEDYLQLRRGLGYKLEREGRLLALFVGYLEQAGATTVTTGAAVEWTKLATGAGRAYLARRMRVARGFASYLAAFDPGTEVPPRELFPCSKYRPTPYIYTEAETLALMAAARALRPPLRAATCVFLRNAHWPARFHGPPHKRGHGPRPRRRPLGRRVAPGAGAQVQQVARGLVAQEHAVSTAPLRFHARQALPSPLGTELFRLHPGHAPSVCHGPPWLPGAPAPGWPRRHLWPEQAEVAQFPSQLCRFYAPGLARRRRGRRCSSPGAVDLFGPRGA